MTNSRNKGFTLLELMTAVAVLGVLLAIGVPSFNATLRANRLVAVTNDLVTALNIARSEAVKRGQGVSVCAANSALNDCSGTTAWDQGWIVFSDDSDTSGNTAGQLDGSDSPLQVYSPAESGYSVAPTSPTTLTYLRFQRSGKLDSTALSTTLKLTPPDCTGNGARQIAIGNTGRISSSKVAC